MHGAIYGDIIGSRFEFDRGGKTKDFELFTLEDEFTDDTAMTIAVGAGLMKVDRNASEEEIKASIIEEMQDWGHRYPDAGYGGRFYGWLFGGRNPKPYGSYGNGSAMRVSAAGWLYDSLERTREVARYTAEVTHNHPEGVKGAECTAAVMYLARTASTKEEILDYITKEFGYDLSETLEQMRERHEHVESCQDSLPKALKSFFEGNSYEDVVRNAVSLGGDTDTLAAIAGAMAEAMYGLPYEIKAEGMSFLTSDMVAVLREFDAAVGRVHTDDENPSYEDNIYIKKAVSAFYADAKEESFAKILYALRQRIIEEGEAPVPMVDVNNVMSSLQTEKVKAGDEITIGQDLRLRFDTIQDEAGDAWIPLFTDVDEVHKGENADIIASAAIGEILTRGTAENVVGVVINPFGQSFPLPKEAIQFILP